MQTPVATAMKDTSGRQRTFKRFKVSFTALVQPVLDEGETESEADAVLRSKQRITAVVNNLSMSGLGLLSPMEFPAGTLLRVEITIGVQTYPLLVAVRRCQALNRPGRQVYECGVQYMKSEANTRFLPVVARYLVERGAPAI